MTLVIFDVDGTLVYSDKLDSKAFAQTYEAIYHRPFPSLDWKTYPHVTDDTIFNTVIQQHFQRKASQEEMEFFKAQFVQTIKNNRAKQPFVYKIVPGAKEMMEVLLKQEKVVVGIATGGWKAPAIVKLKHVKIATEGLFISGADGKNTREQIIEEVLTNVQNADISFERIVYIGDAIWDVKTTRNLKMPLIGLRRKGDVEVLEQAGVSHVLVDYLDIPLFMEFLERAVAPSAVV